MKNGRVCLDVTYVEGHVQPASSYILFRCSTTGSNVHNGTINQTANCMKVDPNPSYTIIVTDDDADAEEVISSVAPVTILGVAVPEYTVILSSSTAPGATPTPTPTGLSLPSFYTLTCNATYRTHNCTRISITDSSDCSTSVW